MAGRLLRSLGVVAIATLGASAASVSISSPLDCSKLLTLANGNRYDLSEIAKQGPLTISSSYDTPPTTTTYTLDVSLCSALDVSRAPAGQQCPQGSRICQRVSSKPNSGGGDGMITHVVPLVTETYGFQASQEGQNGGVSSSFDLTFHGPQYATRDQKVQLEMICDPAAKDTSPEFREYELMDGKAKLRWRTASACAVSNSDDSGGNSGSGSGSGQPTQQGGWGFFSWLFFLGTLGLIAYFAIGTYLNQQQYGVMEIPHRDFWRESPYLVMDIGRHAWKSISGQGGGHSSRPGGYEAL